MNFKHKFFLPTTKQEMNALGWQELDIIIISGDAYIDHPSFSASIIGRYLQHFGFKVGIIPQPNIDEPDDFLVMGEPKLFWGITSGNMDSMVNHYTAQKKLRSEDAYTPAGKIGIRPDRALIRYTNLVKQISKDTPVILGGIEASMRRISHYDYWSDKVRNSILVDSKADILVYGMGEKIIHEIAIRLLNGDHISTIYDVPGTAVISWDIDEEEEHTFLPPQNVCKVKENFHQLTKTFQENYNSKVIYQDIGSRYLRHNIPAPNMTTEELDEAYSLPYMRNPHPRYKGKSIKAWDQIRDSITAHRGCGGGCNFCAIGYHQGKTITSRSEDSILDEVKELVNRDYFHGTISDVGGPSANMYGMKCTLEEGLICKRSSCLYPSICTKLDCSHDKYLSLLRKVKSINKVKNLFIASGIRFDLALKSKNFIRETAKHYIGGHLKLAPEHVVPKVLKIMNKPSIDLYEEFSKYFMDASLQAGKKQSIIPYIIVGHPGTDLNDAVKLALYLKKNNLKLEQVQEFYPTPMTPSTAMYYTELDYQTGKRVHVSKGREIRLQKALVQWYMPENKKYVIEALSKIGKSSLIAKFYQNGALSNPKKEKTSNAKNTFKDRKNSKKGKRTNTSKNKGRR